ncbi:formylglycine-generating enzyme family protein [Botrimarina hoheduenensis]|uniref:Formylglycine-generating sulfatase enzyme n=1 Tax=Botrimarina hoheduenensis TaxID=2528000 RepID=A0A5C5WA76_9BACT|nr:SUMF1/EgtB/PvdO family nonheme iron enzyme [Botrimarina hoheduenensis]TWT47203.1 Formylglycine-generating sulfatase enzyme [Botrimarina hoheduenensis]
MRSICLIVSLLTATQSFADPGVTTEQPDTGRFVKVDETYLVGYQVTIPGSEVKFWMEPVPGGQVTLDGETYELDPYWIGRTEVTWAEYRQYMNLCAVFERFNDVGFRTVTDANRVDAVTAPSKIYDPGFTFDSGDDPRLPAVSMTQYAAKQYTKWLSLITGQFYRLPSEAEWIHATLAGDAETIGANETSWHEDNSDWATQPVAEKIPNAWGLYDTLGNASEWTLDAYEGALTDPDGPGGEPPVRWPTKLYPRVLKGGSAFLPLHEAVATARRPSNDDTWREYDPNVPKSPWWFAYDDAQDVGFRIVRPYRTPTLERRSAYWNADIQQIQKVADFRIDEEGRGERGLVDRDLPNAIRQFNK